MSFLLFLHYRHLTALHFITIIVIFAIYSLEQSSLPPSQLNPLNHRTTTEETAIHPLTKRSTTAQEEEVVWLVLSDTIQ